MAKLEQTIHGDFDQMLRKIEDGILNGSMSATWKIPVIFKAAARGAVSVFLSVTAGPAPTA